MKEGWTYKKLGDIATEMFRGSGIKRDQITIEGTPCVRYGEIYTTYNISFSECFSHTNVEFISSPKYFSHGDLLFAITGESVEDIGKTIAYLGHERCLLGGDIVCMKHNQNPKYLSYALSSSEAIRQKGIGKTKLKVVHTNIPALSEIRIPIPSLSEQQRIVSRLDAAFSHIDELKANAEKQLSEARTLFQKSLVKAMEPKEGWEEKKLIEITHDNCPISYGIVQQGDHIDGGIPVVRPVDMREKYITRENLKYTTQTISDSYKRTILRGDELLLSVRGTTGIISLATPELKGCNVNRGIVPLYFKDQINKDFLYYEMVSPLLQSVFAEKTTGSTLKQINIKDLRLIKLSLPPLSEQQRIVERLDALSAHVRELEENQKKIISECDALKQALLRKVFE